MKTVRTVLAGVGGYGTYYVQSLLSFEKNDLIRLVALVDPFAEKSPLYHLVADRPLYSDLADCLADHPADLVILATPIQHHAEQIKTSLSYGVPVLCEKPLCATRSQAESLIKAQKQSGLQVGIGYQWSFSPVILKAKEDVLSGAYGKPEVFRTFVYWPRGEAYFNRNDWAGRRYDQEGRPVFDSVLNNATAHYLHNMLFFLGHDLAEAAVPERIEARLLRAYDIETFDTALVRMEKEQPGGPVLMALAVSHTTEQTVDPQIDFRFTNGRLTIQDGFLRGYRFEKSKTQEPTMIDYGPVLGPDPVADKIETMVDSIRSGRRLPCDVKTAYAQTAVVSRIHEQCEVTVLEKPDYQVVFKNGDAFRRVPGLESVLSEFIKSLKLPDDCLHELRIRRQRLV